MKQKLANLIEVRKLIALSSIILFIVLSVLGTLQVDFIQTVIITVISFYFGKTTEAVKNNKE
ncbi:hypothetical protein [Pseudobacillus badius]|uniref:hypothetical protein n=1 Tax=Bacillus badius TaxID=1455 RepID=UPI0007B35A61|nr:hypothetical protein [Bacillus badius]KZR58988.1 hypothetical protein A3781_00320 [Bacillus badius]